MQVAEAKHHVLQQLASVYEESEASAIADRVIEHLTGIDHTRQVFEKRSEIPANRFAELEAIIRRLLTHEPVQYVLNEAWFFGLKLYVDRNVLIPRPETEELVKWVLDDCRDLHEINSRNRKILDVGTGSGCIAIALRKSLPMTIETWACDINDLALTVARKNADNHLALVDFVAMDFLDSKQRNQLPLVDIIVSNPPYVPLRDKDLMSANVVKHEPHTALFVPDNNSLVFYEALADFGKQKLRPGGKIYAEIHENRGDQAVNLFKAKGYNDIELRKDMQGKDRMLRASSR